MTATTPERGQRTVLVVEDETDVRTIARLMLERAGYVVTEARNGQDAVETLADDRDAIDVVLLDIMMPVMDGKEALPALREVQPGLPVVFFSGYGRNEVESLLDADGPYTSFLPKPFSKADLIAAIEQALA